MEGLSSEADVGNGRFLPTPILNFEPRNGFEIAIFGNDNTISEFERDRSDLNVERLHLPADTTQFRRQLAKPPSGGRIERPVFEPLEAVEKPSAIRLGIRGVLDPIPKLSEHRRADSDHIASLLSFEDTLKNAVTRVEKSSGESGIEKISHRSIEDRFNLLKSFPILLFSALLFLKPEFLPFDVLSLVHHGFQ